LGPQAEENLLIDCAFFDTNGIGSSDTPVDFEDVKRVKNPGVRSNRVILGFLRMLFAHMGLGWFFMRFLHLRAKLNHSTTAWGSQR
jgi:hypothetical protein